MPRHKGVPNKVTKSVKEAITEAFEKRGGVKALLKWADTNPDAFYAHLWGRLAPREVQATLDVTLLTPEERKARIAQILGQK